MSVLELLQKSGIIGYFLLFLSVISVAIIIEKFIVLRLSKLVPKEDLRLIVDFLSEGNIGDAVEFCKKRKSFLTSIVLDALKNIGKPTKENFLNAFEVTAKRKFMEIERGMPLLATIAAVSPLLGLVGTVLGMIKIFGVLTAGSTAIGNPQELSAGIAEALLTTVFGLLVAIPALFMYNLFQRKLDKIAAEVESAGVLIANNFKGLK
ncbi:MotA/TolQ/ExbB proton channel [Desulfurobacterium thermolithotrophum DSM 11699]|uniref:MotA/TolQ/ExbB proton channel n=1 Tax=Desulfurobacterium thermolithotrophum (strain DSM 11699 / BSA) TaxID=868864 RepID=F0S055_DESTD|nr:MotA/TolQ/ExbB proton channel family protein [Desulfurobacterium thermolithotrophum]ADY73736.1 MotA/TolQ/ExbB proton channel [Desulfurobacterium thermolithotrophum DSM 11699]